jgi:hypothetical protein
MPAGKVTCPECQSVLRPTKPLPFGKKVKCPRCGTTFTVGADSPAARRATAAPPPAKKPESVPRRATDDEDDEEAGRTPYRFRDELEGDGGPMVDYAPDLSIRDLRGPASELVNSPSNKLLIAGVTGFLGWLVFLLTIIIATFLTDTSPADERQEALTMGPGLAGVGMTPDPPVPRAHKEEEGVFRIGSFDLTSLGSYPRYLLIPFLLPLVLGLVYSGLVSAGAVKMQSLESRPWAIATSIMVILPVNAGGLLILGWMVIGLLYGILFEGSYLIFMMTLTVGSIWVGNVAAGIWCLTVLRKPEVIAGFNYKAAR